MRFSLESVRMLLKHRPHLALVVNNDRVTLETGIEGICDPFASLSFEQRIIVEMTLQGWRKEYARGAVNIDSKRVIRGSIPTWADWSGSPWVAHHVSTFRAEMFKNLSCIHVTTMMHLALPPFWIADHPDEFEAVRRYGRWEDETTWLPPEVINSRSVWIERQ